MVSGLQRHNECLICIPITAATDEEAIKDMTAASEYADVLELRIDYISSSSKNPDIDKLLSHKTKPVIVTNRPVREGGRWQGDEDHRIQLLKDAVDYGAEYIDVEHDSVHHILDHARRGCKLIVSYHDFHETPSDLDEIYRGLCSKGADVVKLAVYANDLADNFRVFKLLEGASLPTIALCMGEAGLISRLLAQKYGSYITFASLDEGKESAPGQITCRELLDLYLFKETNAETKVFGIIGNPVAHSISPLIHNSAFSEIGRRDWVYVPFKVEDVADAFNGLKEMGVQGCSVTVPHKQGIMALLDEVDPLARSIGAVNTVVNRNGRFLGYNTDCDAAIVALKEAVGDCGSSSLRGKTVLLLGAGGASRAIAFGLHKEGADVIIANRTYERAEALGKEIGCKWCKMQDLNDLNVDILVNATSAGMSPDVDDIPVPTDVLRPGMVVFDIVYNPLETRLLLEARKRGCVTVDGLAMFINQAVAQFELWTGQRAPKELMSRLSYSRLAGAG